MDTCFLAFGYIAAYATPSLITTRIDVHILNNIKLHLPAVKTPERKTVLDIPSAATANLACQSFF